MPHQNMEWFWDSPGMKPSTENNSDPIVATAEFFARVVRNPLVWIVVGGIIVVVVLSIARK